MPTITRFFRAPIRAEPGEETSDPLRMADDAAQGAKLVGHL